MHGYTIIDPKAMYWHQIDILYKIKSSCEYLSGNSCVRLPSLCVEPSTTRKGSRKSNDPGKSSSLDSRPTALNFGFAPIKNKPLVPEISTTTILFHLQCRKTNSITIWKCLSASRSVYLTVSFLDTPSSLLLTYMNPLDYFLQQSMRVGTIIMIGNNHNDQ
jgi:hypothetical protein